MWTRYFSLIILIVSACQSKRAEEIVVPGYEQLQRRLIRMEVEEPLKNSIMSVRFKYSPASNLEDVGVSHPMEEMTIWMKESKQAEVLVMKQRYAYNVNPLKKDVLETRFDQNEKVLRESKTTYRYQKSFREDNPFVEFMSETVAGDEVKRNECQETAPRQFTCKVKSLEKSTQPVQYETLIRLGETGIQVYLETKDSSGALLKKEEFNESSLLETLFEAQPERVSGFIKYEDLQKRFKVEEQKVLAEKEESHRTCEPVDNSSYRCTKSIRSLPSKTLGSTHEELWQKCLRSDLTGGYVWLQKSVLSRFFSNDGGTDLAYLMSYDYNRRCLPAKLVETLTEGKIPERQKGDIQPKTTIWSYDALGYQLQKQEVHDLEGRLIRRTTYDYE